MTYYTHQWEHSFSSCSISDDDYLTKRYIISPESSNISVKCYKDCPRLGNRSIFYPYSSGNTFTFGVVEDIGSNLTSNISFIETLARASLKTYQASPRFPRYCNEAGRLLAYGRIR